MAVEVKEQSSGARRDTRIGKGAVLEGRFRLEGDLHLDGIFQGPFLFTGGTLFVGQEGKVKASVIEVGQAIIGGCVVGALRAHQQVYLKAGSCFKGWLYTPHLVIEEGARLEADESLVLAGEEEAKGD